MSDGLVRVGIGTRFVYDGELAEVTEMHAAAAGTEVVLRSSSGQGSVLRVALRSSQGCVRALTRTVLGNGNANFMGHRAFR